jgi:predicted nucleic acid-binding protein
VILIDTGLLVAAALHGDVNHVRCVEFFTAATSTPNPYSPRPGHRPNTAR